MVYDALQKRTAYLDALARSLEVLGVKTLISMFPDVCKPSFVWMYVNHHLFGMARFSHTKWPQ